MGRSGAQYEGVTMDHWQYLIVLAACLAITAPLELLGAGVYRQAWRTAGAVLPVAVVFAVWDAIAIAAHVWTYNPNYVTGFQLPGEMPIEELLFFVVIPLCGLLTYNAVDTILEWVRGLSRARAARSS
jgi:lycopene cyclase domain-containing protein